MNALVLMLFALLRSVRVDGHAVVIACHVAVPFLRILGNLQRLAEFTNGNAVHRPLFDAWDFVTIDGFCRKVVALCLLASTHRLLHIAGTNRVLQLVRVHHHIADGGLNPQLVATARIRRLERRAHDMTVHPRGERNLGANRVIGQEFLVFGRLALGGLFGGKGVGGEVHLLLQNLGLVHCRPFHAAMLFRFL